MSARSGRRPWWVFAGILAVVGVAPLVALSYLVENWAADRVRDEIRDRLSGSAALTATFLDEQLRGIEDVAASYARAPGCSRRCAIRAGRAAPSSTATCVSFVTLAPTC